MRRNLSIVGLVALAITAGGGTVAPASSRDDDGRRVLRLTERATDFAYVTNPPAGPLGDYLVFHANLLRRGDRVGTNAGSCFFTSAAGEAHCTVTLSLARGDIAAQGVVPDTTIPFTAVFAVTGGTVAVRGAAGELRLDQRTEELAHLTLRLTRPRGDRD
jgi:hypothetical protein